MGGPDSGLLSVCPSKFIISRWVAAQSTSRKVGRLVMITQPPTSSRPELVLQMAVSGQLGWVWFLKSNGGPTSHDRGLLNLAMRLEAVSFAARTFSFAFSPTCIFSPSFLPNKYMGHG